MVDLIFFRAGDPHHELEIERHGERVPLFDKGNWLRPKPLDEGSVAMHRSRRYRELQTWFPMSQVLAAALSRSRRQLTRPIGGMPFGAPDSTT
jgi:hypothetical protein